MRAIRNCIFAVKTVWHYAPGNMILYIIGYYVPAFFTGLQMLLTQEIVDSGVAFVKGEGALQPVIRWSVMLVLMLVLWVTLQRMSWYQTEVIGTKLTERMTPDIAEQLMNLEYAGFEEQGVQEVFQKMSDSPEVTIGRCFNKTMISIQATISFIFSMAVYFTISPWIGIGVVIISIPTSILGYASAGKTRVVSEQSADAKRRMADLKSLLSNKHAMFEMKLFSSEELFNKKWDENSDTVAEITQKEGGQILAMNFASNLLSAVYIIFIICSVSYSFLAGTISLGQFTAALSGALSLGDKLWGAAWQTAAMLRDAMEMEFYMEFRRLGHRTDLGTVEQISHYDIAFENVSFRYPNTEREILRNVTFYMKEGERIAFVGENGAGKSTIIKLLCGLYEPTTGQITVGGVPVRELSPGLRRKLLSVVFQDFQGYQMTLRENIAFGSIEKLHRDEELLQALELAGGESLLREEKGLDRSLGKLTEDGLDLSKGQWQRVAMARAFVSDAKYIILDEPTAALDPIAESHMYENFARIFAERGTIMISHRLASAKMADRIMVLDGGRIVQTGSHAELMAKVGLYQTMFTAQSSWYEENRTGEGE